MERKDKVKLVAGLSILAIAAVILAFQLLPRSTPTTPAGQATERQREEVVVDSSGAKGVSHGSRAYLKTEPGK